MAPQNGGQPATSEDNLTITTFSQSSRDMHVRVEKPEAGYLCSLSMCARVPLPPDELYDLLISPTDCMRIFKTLKQVNHRRVLSEDSQGNRTVEVDQTGTWRFLMFRGSFTVRMVVEQRRADRTISFRLARPGFMRDFSGTWCVRPFDNASLDALVNKHTPSPLHRLQSSLRAVEQSLGLGATQAESLVVLQQSIAPALAPPPALAKMLQRIAAKQITRIMSDLTEEVDRINSSRSGSSSASSSTAAALPPSAGGDASAATQQHTLSRREKREQQRQAAAAAAEQALEDKKRLAAHVTELR
ncbi:hypothetical protein D9Q98_002264 [Chlorella vulgaris]|uniref:Coenzyme Q-binding protein COQ10 START domain-containing protein n=1 Tax=Chlorella vulgaris TaxID=3077 RepID=A0A9D4TVX9_CHLVU|nr:hypothetical protein D9Q98_002264 [Chlorella vulgaris]